MIKRETIEEFIKLMVEHDLVELDVADGDQSITLRRAEPGGSGGAVAYVQPGAMSAATSAPAYPQASSGGSPGAVVSNTTAATAAEEGEAIKSPMVGTFYSKPTPDADPFVQIGSKVNDSTVVCLVEAMKVFNEIKAECKGEVIEVLVTDGDPVEYGQPLFRIKSA